ncbi:hypothetical protein AAK912_10430 [Merdimmobilis hominis]|uniref:hypothetical protein n=1 Tax=Merdimmobilis hominis TaxID=2897707 RepID=UPI003517EBE8
MASCKFCGKKEPVMYCVCAECMDKLEHRTRWISVKEYLPYGGTVLATDGVTVITAPASSVTPAGAITHWMPLPEPPEEGETDE